MSSMQELDYTSATTTNLGPLTTTFVPAPRCSELTIEANTPITTPGYSFNVDVLYGYQCSSKSAVVSSDCVPISYAAFLDSLRQETDRASGTFPVYSPGNACPAGYGASCTMTSGIGFTTGIQKQWSLLQDGETAIGCCPSGYICDPTAQNFCLSTVAPSQVITVDTQYICSTATAVRGQSSGMIAPSVSVRITAPQVVYVQARETGASASKSDSSTSTSTASAAAQTTSSDAGNSGGISIGGKIGIAFSVAAGSTMAVFATLFLFRNRERQRKREMAMASNLGLVESGRSAARMEAGRPFLPPVTRIDTMSDVSIGGYTAKSELDGSTSAVKKCEEIKEVEEIEQAGNPDETGTVISELPGDVPNWI